MSGGPQVNKILLVLIARGVTILPRGHSSYINCVAVQDTYVITGGADSTIRKWDMTTCECLFVYEGHSSRIQK